MEYVEVRFDGYNYYLYSNYKSSFGWCLTIIDIFELCEYKELAAVNEITVHIKNNLNGGKIRDYPIMGFNNKEDAQKCRDWVESLIIMSRMVD